MVTPAVSNRSFIANTSCLVGSKTASNRRITVIGKITSRYFPRTNTSLKTSSAIPQMKLLIFVLRNRRSLQPTESVNQLIVTTPIPSHNARLPIHRSTPLPQQPSPLPRAITPPPPRGRLRGGLRVRATGRPRGGHHHPNHQPPPFTATPPFHTTPSFPSFPIFRIIVQVFPKIPQFQHAPFSAIYPYFPTQHLTRTLRSY